jgi:hypothetical protein
MKCAAYGRSQAKRRWKREEDSGFIEKAGKIPRERSLWNIALHSWSTTRQEKASEKTSLSVSVRQEIRIVFPTVSGLSASYQFD